MDFPFELRLRHHRIERWLGIGIALLARCDDASKRPRSLADKLRALRTSVRRCGMRSFRRRFGMEESQQCSDVHGIEAETAQLQTESERSCSRAKRCRS